MKQKSRTAKGRYLQNIVKDKIQKLYPALTKKDIRTSMTGENSADIKLLTPKTNEAEGIVPTASTTAQLALGDSLAIASMKYKKFGKMDFKKLHPAGSLGAQLKTVEDIMISGEKIPFVSEKLKMSKALKILSDKKLGILIVRNKKKITSGIITDGEIRRFNQKNPNLHNLTVDQIMTKNPISIDRNSLAAKALSLMNSL